MKKFAIVSLALAAALTGCGDKAEVKPAAPAAPMGAAMTPANNVPVENSSISSGKLLQLIPASGYSYAEVETAQGKLWLAGSALDAKVGDTIVWGNAAVMKNFAAKSLNKTFDEILFVNQWGKEGTDLSTVAAKPHAGASGAPVGAAPGTNPHAQIQTTTPAAVAAAAANGTQSGKVKSVTNSGEYNYLEVVQNGKTVWVATVANQAKVGDKVRWENGPVMKNFTARSLNKTFDEIIFADAVAVAK